MCALLFAAQFTHLSAQTTVMKVWKGGNVTSSISTADVDSITFESNKTDLGDGVYLINGHKFIDLGLPSGLLWAETNIGAKTAADDGNYYAWGETDTKSTSTYNESTYFDSDYTTYSISGKTTLEKQDDAACVNWGDLCRMPTNDEFGELLNSEYCTWTWTSMTASDDSSIEGYKVTSVKNGNSIFLPASGYCGYGRLNYRGSVGFYWSTTLDSNYSSLVFYLAFNSSSREHGGGGRYYGLTVRPVAEP